MSEVLSFMDTLAKIAIVITSMLAMLQSFRNGRALSVLKVEVNGKVSELLEAHKQLAEARAKVSLLEGALLSKGDPLALALARRSESLQSPVSTAPSV